MSFKIAVIVPRYGAGVLGGAESQARGFAEETVRRGWTMEVWTTCARSHYDWKNVHPVGQEQLEGVLVRRFPITRWDPHNEAMLNVRLTSQGILSADDQIRWLECGAHSAPLYAHITRHAAEFDALVALPYAMPLIHYAAWAAPERMIVWPCLHDEPCAYMEPIRLLLENVWGVMFLSPEEGLLAIEQLEITPSHLGLVGGGIALKPIHSELPQTVKRDPANLLYIGRLETGKGLGLLYEYVQRRFEHDQTLRLTVLGQGPFSPPQHPAFDYHGFVSEEDKALACASALALCQPSLNESFSRTIMESWLAGRPVLVHGECAVTRGHVERSKGGLWFESYEEFEGAIDWLQGNPALASRMGRNGRQYVTSNYTWGAVIDRFEHLVKQWRSNGS